MQYDKDTEKVAKKVANYREIYEYETGQLIPNGFHIHHIDGNRNNNHILNLVALPGKLHSAYHFNGGPEAAKRLSFHVQESSYLALSMYERKALFRLLDTLDQCAEYVDRRNELLGWDRVRLLEESLRTSQNEGGQI